MTAYYVDTASSGGDGTTTDTSGTHAAFATVAAVNAATFAADDFIYFKKGCTWRETLSPHNSGTSGHPITFSSYGTGNRPAIIGSTQVSSWTDEGSNIWYAACTAAPTSVYFIDTGGSVHWGKKETAKGDVGTEYDWWFDDPNDRLYVYAASDPGSRYNSVEKTARNYCVDNNSKDYITVDGLEIAYPAQIGVRVMTYTGWTINNCYIHHIGEKNAAIAECVICRGSGLTVKNSTLCNGGNHGVNLSADTGNTLSDALVENNIIYDNYHSNIDCQCNGGTFSGAIIRYNTIYNTSVYDTTYSSGGMYILGEFGQNISNIQVYYNVLYNLSGTAIVIRDKVPSPVIYNNSIYGYKTGCTYAGGIDVFSLGTYDPSNVTIKNNVVMDTHDVAFRSDHASLISACDNNCWYRSSGGSAEYANIGGTAYHYDDFAAYKSATSFDTNGLWEDPLFTDAANADFTLQATSPCIDQGADVSLTQDSNGTSVPQGDAPDIGAYEWYSEAGNHALKRRTGAGAWVKAKLLVYHGGSWEQRPLKKWTGTEWVDVDALGG